MFKLNQPEKAQEFLPKMFGWAVALLKKVKGEKANFEEILLLKYPCVCSYCVKSPCECEPGKKKPVDETLVRATYERRTLSQGRSLNEFQMMFRKIYEHSWGLSQVEAGSREAIERLQKMYTRFVEELSELSEAVRFSHLYPSNFDNELADYTAWLFALVSLMHKATANATEMKSIADVFWPAYPGICTVCLLDLCDCRPSPVRELQSKPSLKQLEYIDSLTQASNRGRFDRQMVEVANGLLLLPGPISCIRIDIDDFKKFNEHPFDHAVGDEALKHLINIVRQKVRTRDRVYRVGGDEFAILCPDLSANEAQGMMSRVSVTLKQRPVPLHVTNGDIPPLTLSVGIAECNDSVQIKHVFDLADKAAIQSKNNGKDRITLASVSAGPLSLPGAQSGAQQMPNESM